MSNLRLSWQKIVMNLFLLLSIFLSCTDEDFATIMLNTLDNSAPIAVTSADILSGDAPLQVNFTGDNSSDDNGIVSYYWEFPGGSSLDPNITQTFNNPGVHDITLTVTDEEGLTDTATLTITVTQQSAGNPPMAVATADINSGDAPLQVNFMGDNSSDDSDIVRYYWELPDGSSSDPNITYTFNNPGVYDITLTVTDDAGLSDSTTLTITVTQGSGDNTEDCVTNGGLSTESGLKTWCWGDVELPTGYNDDAESFSDGQLYVSSHSNIDMVTKSGDRLYFKVNPRVPVAQNWGGNFNYRAEIRDSPSDAHHPVGTEQWFGWNYKLGSDYIHDTDVQWLMWQTHAASGSPPVSINSYEGGSAGDPGLYLFVHATSTSSTNLDNITRVPLGIELTADLSLDFVMQLISGDETTGHIKLWINGNVVYDQTIRTVYTDQAYGGYVKWGIYKWGWKNEADILLSEAQGISELNTSMGPLRILTRFLDAANYLNDSYSEVAPR
jgi:PKD repeat protein